MLQTEWIYSPNNLKSFSFSSLLILRASTQTAPILTEEERDEFYNENNYLPELLGDGFPDPQLKLQALSNIRAAISQRLGRENTTNLKG